MDTTIYVLYVVPALIGICVSALLLVIRKEMNEKSTLNLRSYVIGYFICIALNIFVLIITMGFFFVPCFIITFGPLVFFSYMINKQVVKDAKFRNVGLKFIYKIVVSMLIWFIAFFPFSLWGVKVIVDIPKNIARNKEIVQLQDKISSYETYADLTSFDLGLYKLQNKSDKYLWDITKPKDYVIDYDGVDMVFENHYNCKDNESWDDSWGNSNKGKDVIYDVYFHEGTFIIVTPLWEKPGTLYYWGYIYLCKNIVKNADMFAIGVTDPAVVGKLRKLPGEKLTRKELSEKLGKIF